MLYEVFSPKAALEAVMCFVITLEQHKFNLELPGAAQSRLEVTAQSTS